MVPVDLFDELYSTSCHLISMSYFFDEMVLVEYHLVEKIIGRMASAKWSKIKVEKFDLDV